MSRGDAETNKLKGNIEDQLNRLLTQLSDLEEMKDELDNDEYEQTRQETMAQLSEFEVSLQKLLEGNITLVSDIGSVQLRIQDAIREAFKSPEVTKMFVKKENGALRRKLASLWLVLTYLLLLLLLLLLSFSSLISVKIRNLVEYQ